MSINSHGMPSRVRAIAEIGRLLGDPRVAEADKRAALDVLVQDHADLDEVEAMSALWALAQVAVQSMPPAAERGAAPVATSASTPTSTPADPAEPNLAAHAREALLACGPQLMHDSLGAQQFLDLFQTWFGRRQRDAGTAASAAFLRIERLALDDAELAARLALFR